MDALTAAGPARPPAEWFDDPQLDGPTPLQITDDGRVYGHAAAWGSCHVGIQGRCVTPPRSPSGYRYFHLGERVTAADQPVDVGQITLGTGHAPLHWNAEATKAHYDDTGTALVDVRAGEDEHGIWVAGAVRPDAPEDRELQLRAAKLSGDWRTIDGHLELVGLLAVNVPGFPIPRTRARIVASAASTEAPVALVASGIVTSDWTPVDQAAYERRIRSLAARATGGIEGLAALATQGANP